MILAAGKCGSRIGEKSATLLPIGEQACLERIVLGMKEAGIHLLQSSSAIWEK